MNNIQMSKPHTIDKGYYILSTNPKKKNRKMIFYDLDILFL